jgi:aminoglycoside phosphotransferase (APT) family kinase protein
VSNDIGTPSLPPAFGEPALEPAATLGRLGVLPPGCVPEVTPLAGGVSSEVLAVTWEDKAVVVKRALPRLRVQEVWDAPLERTLTEARALRLVAGLTPRSVPPVLALDSERYVLAMGRAPAGYRDWKSMLLAGEVSGTTAARLGRLLAIWHAATTDRPPGELAWFEDVTAFDQLRVDPFYRWSLRSNPDLSGVVESLVERMTRTRSCLVHGDFTPKNILVGSDGLWVIDWEVAHVGDPVFDLALMLAHLACKIIARPVHRAAYAAAGSRFVSAYEVGRAAAGTFQLDRDYLSLHTAALVLARIDGKSPVDYLDPGGRADARAGARGVLVASEPMESLSRTFFGGDLG